MKIIKRKDSCTCEYCIHYGQIIDPSYYFPNHKGICKKHTIIRFQNNKICTDFVLRSGIHTARWYPGKNE